ncbi:MAG: formate dehydrogenase accessory sulfurtransferase FdhD [Flavobacteriales bacterium]|nr:formate dehydrogenase accessory sulfurtransferase FdhD [Flavobacteriales bacterium]
MKEGHSEYEGIKFDPHGSERVSDALTIEEALQIDINSKPFTVIMRTPGNENEMVRGLLYTEDIYKGDQNLDLEVVSKSDLGHITHVNVEIQEEDLGKGYLNSRTMLSVSSCGICGKRELGDLAVSGKKLDDHEVVELQQIMEMFEKMELAQQTFKTTGGSHCASIFDDECRLLAAMEDIGRHNAVDKAIGATLISGELRNAKCILVSGRVSYEIVTKAFMAKIQFLAAVSAPSTLAVDYAKELGLTLFAFSRENKTTCYAHPQRVLDKNKKEVA